MINNLGGCYGNLGQHDKAKALFLEAMSIADQLEDTLQVVYVCGNLGNCCFQAGDLDEAISYYRLQLATSQKLGREDMFDYPARASMGLGVALRFQVRAMIARSFCVMVRASRRAGDPGQYRPHKAASVAARAAASPSKHAKRGCRGFGSARDAEGPFAPTPDSKRVPGPGFYAPAPYPAPAAGLRPPPSASFESASARPCLSPPTRPGSPARLGYGLAPMPWAVERGRAAPTGSGLPADPRESSVFRSALPRLHTPYSATRDIVGHGSYTTDLHLSVLADLEAVKLQAAQASLALQCRQAAATDNRVQQQEEHTPGPGAYGSPAPPHALLFDRFR